MNHEYIVDQYKSGKSIPRLAKELHMGRRTISNILHINGVKVSKLVDLTGRVFSKLTVLKRVSKPLHLNGENRPYWLCECECNNRVVISSSNLRSGSIKSCGCSQYLYGKDHPMFGKVFTMEHRANIAKGVRKSIGKISGENHHNWKGGITPIAVKLRTSRRYRDWRTSVFRRDGYVCSNCGDKSQRDHPVVLNAHHKLSVAEYPDKMFEIENGITLCVTCHDEQHSRRRQR